MPYLFGKRRRSMRQTLEAAGKPLSDAELATLAQWPSFDERLLRYLERQKLPASHGPRFDEICRRPWSLLQIVRIGCCCSAPGLSPQFLSPLIDFPRYTDRPDSIDEALWQLAQSRGCPVSTFCGPELVLSPQSGASATEKLAVARLLLDPGNERTVLQLLAAAHDANCWSTLAAVFDSELLDAKAWDPAILAAFHALPWDPWSRAKWAFAGRIDFSSARGPEGRDESRFQAARLMTKGQFAQALSLLETLLPAREGEHLLLREVMTACARAGRRPGSPVLREAFQTYRQQLPAGDSGKWLELLLGQGRGATDVAPVGQALAEWRLPRVEDPLFPAVAEFLLQQTLSRSDRKEHWPRAESRLAAEEPLWLWKLPATQRQYFLAVRGLMAASTDSIATALQLQRLLLLPVDLRWCQRVLSLMSADFRGDLLIDGSGHPTRSGLLLNDLAIRLVDWLETSGRPLPRELEAPLCSEDPRKIAAALQSHLTDLEY